MTENQTLPVRTWPDPRIHEAQLALTEARRTRSFAERRYLEGLSDRQHQEQREEQIQRQNLGTPYYLPPSPTFADDGHDLMSNPTSTIFRWVSDDDLAQRKAAFDAAEKACQKAQAAYDKAVAAGKPVTETQLRAEAKKLNAQYAVNKPMKLLDVQYAAGQVIPPQVTDSLDHWTKRRWLDANIIREIS